MGLLEIGGRKPRIAHDCFIAENATIAGDVELLPGCSVWFAASIRAEYEQTIIRSRSNVQDNCTIHTDAGFPCEIGEGVSIGHGAIIHGATIGSNCLIGMGAILLNGSRVGADSVVGAGSLILQSAIFAERSLILGSPAKVVRKVTDAEVQKISENAKHYDEFRAQYLRQTITMQNRVNE